jgi:hypothetical protein
VTYGLAIAMLRIYAVSDTFIYRPSPRRKGAIFGGPGKRPRFDDLSAEQTDLAVPSPVRLVRSAATYEVLQVLER